MRKESLENLTLTGNIEDKRDNFSFCEWMDEQGAGGLAERNTANGYEGGCGEL